MSSHELYIGNLDPDTKSQEIKDIFERYGDVSRCEVKFGSSIRAVVFAFVAFKSSKDAERAQRKEHGRNHHGRRLIVEFSKTTPGQNGQRRQRIGSEKCISHGNSNIQDHFRSRDLNNSKCQNRRRQRSRSFTRRSSVDRSSSNEHRSKRSHSSLSKNRKSSAKRHRSSPCDDQRHHSHKNGHS